MEKLDPQSVEILPTSVDFFNTKPNLVAFQQSSSVEYPPMTALGSGPIHFTINTGQTYLDLSETYLLTKFRIAKKVNDKFEPITKEDDVSFIQGFGATCIKNLKVSFNRRNVYNSNDLYAYNAYFRRRLGLGVSRNEGLLQTAGYFEDGLSQVSGPGFEARRALYENDQTFETICTVDADIFRQQKLLLNQIVVDIEITLHKNFFTLLASGDTEYQYHIVDCSLYAKQHMLVPQLDFAIQQKMNADNLAKYSYTRSIMKNFYITPGRFDFRASLFNDYVPKRVFVGLVDAKAFNGHIGMSPFEFQPYNLETIQLSSNGMLVPTYPYAFESSQYTRAFKDLYDATDGVNGINYQKFVKHSCIFAFDMQSQHSDDFIEAQLLGTTAIALQFKNAVPANGLQLVILGEFNSILALDKTRTITTAIPV